MDPRYIRLENKWQGVHLAFVLLGRKQHVPGATWLSPARHGGIQNEYRMHMHTCILTVARIIG